jgi:TonB family protein
LSVWIWEEIQKVSRRLGIIAKLMRAFLSFLLLLLTFPYTVSHAQPQAPSLEQLKQRLATEYEKIEKTIASPPSLRNFQAVAIPGRPPYDVQAYKRGLRDWQDDLAQSFKAAADTVAEILKLNPPDADYWRERLETLQLYGEPVSNPSDRKVFGSGEVQRSARLLEMPLADYTPEARAAKAHGDVRLRLVLAADGKVKNIFPTKSLRFGLTESAMAAAAQIKFEPAIRNNQPASQFLTLVYEFDKSGARKPYIPRTEF